jgi:hypothetical protein
MYNFNFDEFIITNKAINTKTMKVITNAQNNMCV